MRIISDYLASDLLVQFSFNLTFESETPKDRKILEQLKKVLEKEGKQFNSLSVHNRLTRITFNVKLS